MAKLGGAAWVAQARSKAQAQFAEAKKAESEVWRERDKIRQSDAEKTARLKALRLAHEAKLAAEAALAPPKPVPVRARAAAETKLATATAKSSAKKKTKGGLAS